MKRKIIVIMILTFLIISLSQTCFVKAQSTPYSVSEKLTANTSGWHNVSSIKQGDPVFISIPSTRGISSALYYPNLTLASSVANTLSTVYQLSAQIAGTYVLRIDSGLDNNYTIHASHPVVPEFPMGFVPLMIVLGFVVIFFKKSGWVNSKL